MLAYSIKILAILLLIGNFGKAPCFSQEKKEQTKQETSEENKPVVKNIAFDKSTGVVSYELSLPARVRIRIGIADGALYRTIIDWDERGIGKHQESWDGMDSSKGRVKLTGRDDLVFTFNYFTAGNEYRQNIQMADILPLSENLVGRHLPNLQVNQMHKAHPREFCHSPAMNIRLPKGTPRNRDGVVIIKGETPIEISVSEKDKIWFNAERYSLHIFIDDVFIHGELEGYTPYTWIFNPQGINEGEHLIVINLAGFADHYGITTLPVYIKNKGK
ncbi:MAG: hypothetical protein V1709_00590 [Planctomycetota bacterium]